MIEFLKCYLRVIYHFIVEKAFITLWSLLIFTSTPRKSWRGIFSPSLQMSDWIMEKWSDWTQDNPLMYSVNIIINAVFYNSMYLIIIIIIKPMFIQHLLCARHRFRDVTCSSSFNSNNNPMVQCYLMALLVK